MLDIQFTEPKVTRYLRVNSEGNLECNVPITTGESISRDNTCRSTLELRTFFGQTVESVNDRTSVFDELARYIGALAQDLRTMQQIQNNHRQGQLLPPEFARIQQQKQTRLETAQTYLEALNAIRAIPNFMLGLTAEYGAFPELIKQHFLANKSNMLSMILSPLAHDSFLRLNDAAVFSLSRELLTDHFRRLLLDSFRQNPIQRAISITEQLKASVDRELEAGANNFPLSLNDLLRLIARAYQQRTQKEWLYELDVIQEQLNEAAFSEDELIEIADYELAKEIIDVVLNANRNSFVSAEEASPFLIPRAEYSNDTLSIITQFFFAETNIYCYAKGLTRKNFGELLDARPQPQSIVNQIPALVISNLQNEGSVEDALLTFINNNMRQFELSRALTADEQNEIKELFRQHYATIKAADHKDEFLILTDKAPGVGVSCAGIIAVPLHALVALFPQINRRLFPALPVNPSPYLLPLSEAEFAKSIKVSQSKEELIDLSFQSIPQAINLLFSAGSRPESKFFQELDAEQINTIKQHANWLAIVNQAPFLIDNEQSLQAFYQVFGLAVVEGARNIPLRNNEIRAIRALYMTIYGAPLGQNLTLTEELNAMLGLLVGEAVEVAENPNGGLLARSAHEDVTAQVERMIANAADSFYLSQDMLMALFAAVPEYANHESREYQDFLHAENNSAKLLAAGQILSIQISIREVMHDGQLIGYVIANEGVGNNDASRVLENICADYAQEDGELSTIEANALIELAIQNLGRNERNFEQFILCENDVQRLKLALELLNIKAEEIQRDAAVNFRISMPKFFLTRMRSLLDIAIEPNQYAVDVVAAPIERPEEQRLPSPPPSPRGELPEEPVQAIQPVQPEQALPNINQARDKQAVFVNKLQALNAQISELRRRYEEEEQKNGQSEAYAKLHAAYDAGIHVFAVLERAGRDYFANNISHAEFLACRDTDEFKSSLKTLKEHRGAKGVLEAVINVLLYLPQLLASLWTGKMSTFKLNTESINKVDEVLDSAQKAAPGA